ncbi:hypothetical protein HN51_052490, partial [Arachis hypogaea]
MKGKIKNQKSRLFGDRDKGGACDDSLLGRGEVLGDGEGFLDDGTLCDGEGRRGRDSRLGDEEHATAADCVRRMAGQEKGAADGGGGRDALRSTTLRIEGALSRRMGISEQGNKGIFEENSNNNYSYNNSGRGYGRGYSHRGRFHAKGR